MRLGQTVVAKIGFDAPMGTLGRVVAETATCWCVRWESAQWSQPVPYTKGNIHLFAEQYSFRVGAQVVLTSDDCWGIEGRVSESCLADLKVKYTGVETGWRSQCHVKFKLEYRVGDVFEESSVTRISIKKGRVCYHAMTSDGRLTEFFGEEKFKVTKSETRAAQAERCGAVRTVWLHTGAKVEELLFECGWELMKDENLTEKDVAVALGEEVRFGVTYLISKGRCYLNGLAYNVASGYVSGLLHAAKASVSNNEMVELLGVGPALPWDAIVDGGMYQIVRKDGKRPVEVEKPSEKVDTTKSSEMTAPVKAVKAVNHWMKCASDVKSCPKFPGDTPRVMKTPVRPCEVCKRIDEYSSSYAKMGNAKWLCVACARRSIRKVSWRKVIAAGMGTAGAIGWLIWRAL